MERHPSPGSWPVRHALLQQQQQGPEHPGYQHLPQAGAAWGVRKQKFYNHDSVNKWMIYILNVRGLKAKFHSLGLIEDGFQLM